MPRTVMLIHGAWLNARAWEGFKARYESRGFTVLTPDWPYDDRPPDQLRASPRPGLARTGQKAIIDYHDRLVRALPEPPILIGHSFGGVTAPRDQVDALYDRYIVPTAGRVYWDGIFKAAGTINWRNPARPPMLLIGGGVDLIADASMTRAIYEKQKQAPSPTELRIFPDRSHWTGIDVGWEEVADYALGWALDHADGPRVTA